MGDTEEKRPDYLVVGHISKDLTDDPPGYVPGGTALYATLTAQRLGLQAAMVTSFAVEDDHLLAPARDAGVWIHRVPSGHTTTFKNSYDANGNRRQIISGHASPITVEDIPGAWRHTTIVHLGPIAHELDADMPSHFNVPLLGITPQGWLRSWDPGGRIVHTAWPLPPALLGLPPGAFVVISIEDVDNDEEILHRYINNIGSIAVTQGDGEAYLCTGEECALVPALTARPVDPTGAGDVFAAALFVRYRETHDLADSARFAHAAAALIIEGFGPSAVPSRQVVERRMLRDARGPVRTHPRRGPSPR